MTQQRGFYPGHAIKKLLCIVGLPVLMIWSMFSVYRVIACLFLVQLFIWVPFFIHRELTRRVFARDGFRLVAFSEPSAFISWSFDWPWWCELYGYRGAVVSESGEEFDCSFSLQGPIFAIIRPSVRSTVHACNIEVDDDNDVNREDFARRLQNLRVVRHLNLNLGYSPITDVELVQIQNWENLESLSLEHTEVTDQGLAYLKGLTKLKGINLYETETTPTGRNMLRIVLSDCAIYPEP